MKIIHYYLKCFSCYLNSYNYNNKKSNLTSFFFHYLIEAIQDHSNLVDTKHLFLFKVCLNGCICVHRYNLDKTNKQNYGIVFESQLKKLFQKKQEKINNEFGNRGDDIGCS